MMIFKIGNYIQLYIIIPENIKLTPQEFFNFTDI